MRAAVSSSPPLRKNSVIPVPRNVWQQISAGSPAFNARRLTICSAECRDSPLSLRSSFCRPRPEDLNQRVLIFALPVDPSRSIGWQNPINPISIKKVIPLGKPSRARALAGYVRLRGKISSTPEENFHIGLTSSDYRKYSSGGVEAPPPISFPLKQIDWKGHYDGGEATRLLTFVGPNSRYNGPSIYLPNIFRDGKRAYVAPNPVVGAAIQKNSAGEQYIVVATYSNSQVQLDPSLSDHEVVFYRRDASLLDFNSGVYDSVNNPTGWQVVGTHTLPSGRVLDPWFFMLMELKQAPFVRWQVSLIFLNDHRRCSVTRIRLLLLHRPIISSRR